MTAGKRRHGGRGRTPGSGYALKNAGQQRVYRKGGAGKKSGSGFSEALLAGRVSGSEWREAGSRAETGHTADTGHTPEAAAFGPSGETAHLERPAEQFRADLYQWFSARYANKPRPAFSRALSEGMAFREGFAAAAGLPQQNLGLPVPLSGRAAAVITASNEEATLGLLLNELARLPLAERIVVLNGCIDGSFAEARKHAGVTVAHFPQRLGHDVGRSVGASLASGDAILFLDGDMSVPAEELAAFLYEQESGLDVVLNDITEFLPPFGSQDEVTRCKRFLNLSLGRPDLGSNSLTAVPHVLSQKALDAIGRPALAVPPKAQAIAIMEGLLVKAPCTADVIGRNRLRQTNSGAGNRVARLIIGDHAEALGEAQRRMGHRLLWSGEPRPELAKARNAG